MKNERNRISQSSSKISQQKIFQLRVELEGAKPEINRVLLVRADIGLDLLHAILQIAVGWTNSHLHQFIVGQNRFSDPQFNLNEDLMDPSDFVYDESKELLASAVKNTGSQFTYEYDFGDSWNHRITIEDIVTDDGGLTGFAKCIGGKGACPPEDCGGTWGYADLLDTISDPTNDEYESMLEWVGGSFDPEAFDMKKVNRFLMQLKWEHPTVEQLASVLIARDAIRAVNKKAARQKSTKKAKR